MTQKTITETQEKWEELSDKGKQCADSGKKDPVFAFRQIYGDPEASPEEVAATKKKMEAKCKKLKQPFVNPYETTA